MASTFRIFLIAILGVTLFGQDNAAFRQFGGDFERLRPEQQQLVLAWVQEYGKVTGKTLDARDGYNALPLSYRTTFDAVTHALSRTQLTAEDGTSLGTALELIELVEAVHGQIPHVRGDHQYRLYVLLKPKALDVLYRCQQFKRTRDNSIYHIGYPINFRQQGGVPSIQVSVTRTGRRADIDVDYRSSSGPKALFNGHLTSANSDVRAGNNYVRHADRWQGFQDWWRNLLGLFRLDTREENAIALDVEIPEKPKVEDSAPVQEAVQDFFQTWLVDGKPDVALSYLSVRSYSCLAEFHTGEEINSGLAALRILEHMKQGLAAYGKSASLEEVIQGYPVYAPGAQPVSHDFGALFSIEHLPDDVARSLDCRARLHTDVAAPLPEAEHRFGDYFASMARLRKEEGPVTVLTQLWTKEEGHWKVVSWHLEHPFHEPEVPKVAPKEHMQAQMHTAAPPDEQLVRATERFFTAWLMERRYDEASGFFSPEAAGCDAVKEASSPRAFLASVGDHFTRKAHLADLITTVDHGHLHLEELPHPSAQAYLLARVSDELGAMAACDAGTPHHTATTGSPLFDAGLHQTIFRLKDAPGLAASLSFQWAKRGSDWKIVAVAIEDH